MRHSLKWEKNLNYAEALVGNDAAVDGILPLSNGGFVARSDTFDCTASACGTDAFNAGAITHVPASTVPGITISQENSAVGLNAEDKVGSGTAIALPNGDFVVACPACDYFGIDRGAVSYFSSTTGTSGYFVSLDRTLLGKVAGDAVGSGGIKSFADGSYVIFSPAYDGGHGAVTLIRAGEPIPTQIDSSNSVVCPVPAQGQSMVFDYDVLRAQLVVGQPAANKITLLNGHLFADGFEDAP